MTSIYSLILKIFLSLRRKIQYKFYTVVLLSFCASFLEVISIGALIPFLQIILDNSFSVSSNSIFFYINNFLNLTSKNDYIIFFSILFIIFSIFSGVFRIFLLFYNIKLSNQASADIGVQIYKKTLFQSFQSHVLEGTSVVISGIIKKTQEIAVVLFSVVDFFSSVLIFTSIFFFIIYLDPVLILISIIFFSLIYILFSLNIKNYLNINSKKISQEQTYIVKALQEGLGSIRDVLLNQTQIFYLKMYEISVKKLNKASGTNEFLNQSPRLFMEMVVLVFISLLILTLIFFERSINSSLVSIGILILGSQRMLPLINKIYLAWTLCQGKRGSLEDIVHLLSKNIPYLKLEKSNIELEKSQKIKFKKIQFKNVDFKYDNSRDYIFQNLNFNLFAKSKIGIFGKSGSGKSTFLDLLAGLLSPTSGEILIDDKALNDKTDFFWKKKISYISQDIFLYDTSIKNNIALIDQFSSVKDDLVIDCAKKSKIHEFIISNGGYEAQVGERGVRLSGGQKQRIGIARALYKSSELIIFDEATSALDKQTEEDVLNSIYSLDKNISIIIVSHRIKSLVNCDIIYELANKNLIHVKN
jgi:ABC-type multidrug transport system fused ATPase/permease subunit